MPHITIEYTIMIPMLLLQIFLFPLTASWLMETWVNSRRTLALQDVAGHLASTMQQLYFSLNHATILVGKASYSPGLPPFIENMYYTANASIRPVSAPASNSTKVIDLTVRLTGTEYSVSTRVILGVNVDWHSSVFVSNSTHACVIAEKELDGNITLWFDS